MNHAYRLVWNEGQRCYVPAAEGMRARGKSGGRRGVVRLGAPMLMAAALCAYSSESIAGPAGGEVVSGQGNITHSADTTTIHQQSQNLSLNWQDFSIGTGEKVQFVQPSSSAIALNRVIGNEASRIFGRLEANGRVFLVNPNGVLFAPTAQVDVGGLVASTLNISDSDFVAGRYKFESSEAAPGSVVNQGNITAGAGSSIALLGGKVSNQGTLRAELGTVALAAGRGVTLDFNGNKLMNVQVDESALGALAENHQLIQASGGTVIMTAAARDALLETVVNNTGVIEARTVQNQGGVIKLLGGFDGGTVNVDGKLDASAPDSGNGGYIDTSGAHVKVADTVEVTTRAAHGSFGNWVIDPPDYLISETGGDISGAALGAQLDNTNVTIASSDGTAVWGDGSIVVHDAISWSSPTTLTMNAIGSVNINAAITNTGTPGGGSGVTLRADSAGACVSGGPTCGTVNIGGSGTGNDHITADTVNIHYNPIGSNTAADANGIGPSYSTPTNYAAFVTGTLTASMLVNDVAQLQALNTNRAGKYILGKDIDASATLNWNAGAGFAPIGNIAGSTFTGTLEGAGHTITGLHINRPSLTGVGLFASVGTSGVVADLSLVTSVITGRNTVGGLAGRSSGTLRNVSVSGIVQATGPGGRVGGIAGEQPGGNIINSAVFASSITGVSAGGLVGFGTTITNSHYDIDGVLINGSTQLLPGGFYHDLFQDWIDHGRTLDIARIASLPYDAVSSSYLISDVQGLKDLLGFAEISSYRFMLTADVDLASVPGWYIPRFTAARFDGAGYTLHNLNINRPSASDLGLFGIVGQNSTIDHLNLSNPLVSGSQRIGAIAGTNLGTIINSDVSGPSSAPARITGTSTVGGLVGRNQGVLSGVESTVSVDGTSYVGGIAGANETGATILTASAYGDVDGDNYAGGLVGTNRGSLNDADSYGHTTGITNTGGLAGSNETGGTLTNAHALGTVSGTENVGGLVGLNNTGATLTDVYATGAVNLVNAGGSSTAVRTNAGGLAGLNKGTVTNAHATGQVTGTVNTGGLVGVNDTSGTLTDVYATGAVKLVDTGGSGQEVRTNAGGLAGLNNGTVTNAYATGAVSGLESDGDLIGQNFGGLVGSNSSTGTITDSHATGFVTTRLNAGGLVGLNDGGTLANVYATGTVSGLDGAGAQRANRVGGLVGSNGIAETSRGTISNAYATGQVSGAVWVGGLVGWNDGTVENARTSGEVTTASGAGSQVGNIVGGLVGVNTATGQINDTYSTAVVRGANQTGGLVGQNTGTLTNSYASGPVEGRFLDIGGLIGVNEGTVENAYATGAVTGFSRVGGLLGSNSATGTINSTYSTGHVTATSTNSPIAGGLVGDNLNVAAGSISNSFWDTQTSGTLVSDGGIGLTTAQMMSPASLAGLDFTNGWFLVEGRTRPFLRSEYSTTITNAHELQLVSMDLSASYTLANDIDLSEITQASGPWDGSAGFAPIGDRSTPFSGSFDGAGHTISNLYIERATSDDVGLFGTVAATVSNLTLLVNSITGREYVGGLAGSNAGTLSNVTVATNVLGVGGKYTGGIVGYNSGTIIDSMATGSVAGAAAGALVGLNDGIVTNSHYDIGQLSINGSNRLTLGGLYSTQYQDWINHGRTLDISSYASLQFDGTDYLISNTQGLKDLLGFADIANYRFRLTADLDLSSEAGLYIPAFMGAQFDGAGHTISNLFVDQQSGFDAGLFGYVSADSTITRLFVSDPSVTGGRYVGAIAGRNHGTIRDSGVSGENNGFNGIAGTTLVGGLVGANSGTLSNVYSAVPVFFGRGVLGGLAGMNAGIIENAYATGVVGGDEYVGGLVGLNAGDIRRTYSMGEVAGISNTGGLVGANVGPGSVTDSFWDVELSTQPDQHDGRGIGKTADEMMQASTFSAWGSDISAVGGSNAVWRIYEGYTSPLLRSFMTDLDITVDGAAGNYNGTDQTFAVNYQVPGYANASLVFAGDATYRNAGTYDLGRHLYSSQRGYDIRTVGGLLNINRAYLLISSSDVVKTYDGTTHADGHAVIRQGTLFGTDQLRGGTFEFGSKNAGNQAVIASGVTVDDGNGGNNYIVTLTNNDHSFIEKADLTITAGAHTKTYDGTLNSGGGTGGSSTGIQPGDILSWETAFASKDVLGTGGSTLDVSWYRIVDTSGVDMRDNYNVSTISAAGTIEKANLTVTSGDYIKVYDGTTAAGGNLILAEGTLFGSDWLTGGTFAFTDKNAGTGKALRTSGVTVNDGNGGNNYAITYRDNTTSTIRQRALGYWAIAQDKVYDGTTTASATIAQLMGLVGNETLNVGSVDAVFNSKDVASARGVIVTGATLLDGANGGLARNYTITAGDGGGVASIIPKALTYTTTAQNKVYDGNSLATVALSGLTGLVGDETVTASGVGLFNSVNVVDANLVTVTNATLADGTNGGLASNYSIEAGGTVAARITPKTLTYTTAAENKVYDGTTAARVSLTGLSGYIGSEQLTARGVGQFNSKDVAAANLVTVTDATLSDGANGGLASNYSIAAGGTASASITPRELTYTLSAQNKVYDGTTLGTVTLSGLTGLVGNEAVTASGTGAFNSKNVLDARFVTLTSATLHDGVNGGLARNYSVTAGNTANASITPASLTITAGNAARRTGAPNPAFNVTYNGFVAGETAANLTRLPATSTSADTTSPPGRYAIDVLDAVSPNYSFTYVPGTLTVVDTLLDESFLAAMAYVGNVNSELFLDEPSDDASTPSLVGSDAGPDTYLSGLLTVESEGLRLPPGVH